MGTGISRRLAVALAAGLLVLAGCGGEAGGRRPEVTAHQWATLRIPSGASIAYPSTWVRLRSDPGSASVALVDRHHHFRGYLGLTPRQGAETLANWPRFRTGHNTEEGDRHVTTLAVKRDFNLRTGHGTCVQDSYTTRFRTSYVELACLIAGQRTTTVVIAAAPPTDWRHLSPTLLRALSTLRT